MYDERCFKIIVNIKGILTPDDSIYLRLQGLRYQDQTLTNFLT